MQTSASVFTGTNLSFLFIIFLIRSELQLHLIWNYFVSVKLPVLTSGKNFPPCKWAAQVSLRLCDLQHKTHIKICIPEEIKNLGKPSPAAPALSPDHALSPRKQTESKELSAQVNLNWSRHSECENSTWNGQWVSEQRDLWAQLQRKNRETGNLKSFADRVSSLWVGLCWRGWTCFIYKTSPYLAVVAAGTGLNSFDRSSACGQPWKSFLLFLSPNTRW